jgi:hypothetical protein
VVFVELIRSFEYLQYQGIPGYAASKKIGIPYFFLDKIGEKPIFEYGREKRKNRDRFL